PYAKAIRRVVGEKTMPPWHADPHVGRFSNDRRMTEADVQTVLDWVAAGALEGDPSDLPPAPRFTEGWTIGPPDAQIGIPKPIEVPADGTVDYQYVVVPTAFKEERWVAAAEVRAGNREVVHHVIVFVLPPEGPPAD